MKAAKQFIKNKDKEYGSERWTDDPIELADAFEEYAHLSDGEVIPDLSELRKKEKDEFVLDMVKLASKNLLSVFVALGLETHIEATVVNDADGNHYAFSFKKVNQPK